VKYWVNQGNGQFSAEFTRSGMPLYDRAQTVLRQADINGNGSQDILWNTHPGGGPDTFAFLDFAPGEQPYLLKTITNGIGTPAAPSTMTWQGGAGANCNTVPVRNTTWGQIKSFYR